VIESVGFNGGTALGLMAAVAEGLGMWR